MNMNEEEINGCKLPRQFNNYDDATKEKVIKYLSQLTPIEVKAYKISVIHLKTSFNLLRSNGYNEWLKEQEH
jgi:hypothetical protein